jgi:hypothetical protein
MFYVEPTVSRLASQTQNPDRPILYYQIADIPFYFCRHGRSFVRVAMLIHDEGMLKIKMQLLGPLDVKPSAWVHFNQAANDSPVTLLTDPRKASGVGGGKKKEVVISLDAMRREIGGQVYQVLLRPLTFLLAATFALGVVRREVTTAAGHLGCNLE